jgi:hypothetical protein
MGGGTDRSPLPAGTASGNSGSSGDNGRSGNSNKNKRNSTGSGITRTMLIRGHTRHKSASGATTSENSDGVNVGQLSYTITYGFWWSDQHGFS